MIWLMTVIEIEIAEFVLGSKLPLVEVHYV